MLLFVIVSRILRDIPVYVEIGTRVLWFDTNVGVPRGEFLDKFVLVQEFKHDVLKHPIMSPFVRIVDEFLTITQQMFHGLFTLFA